MQPLLSIRFGPPCTVPWTLAKITYSEEGGILSLSLSVVVILGGGVCVFLHVWLLGPNAVAKK